MRRHPALIAAIAIAAALAAALLVRDLRPAELVAYALAAAAGTWVVAYLRYPHAQPGGDERDEAPSEDALPMATPAAADEAQAPPAVPSEPEETTPAAVSAPDEAAEIEPDRPVAPEAAAPEPTKPAEPEPPRPSFDFDAFRRRLLLSSNPLSILSDLVRKVERERRKGLPVDPVEAFLARQLAEAGLTREMQKEIGEVSVAWPHRSEAFYLRVAASRLSYGALIVVLAVEAALNAVKRAHDYYGDDLVSVREEDLLHLWQRMRRSICAQVPDVDTADWSYLAMPWQVPFGPEDQGEWSVRQSLSEAIESVQVPYRLEARFRCNVAEGDVAIEFAYTPHRAFPHSSYADGLGIVAATLSTRRREASLYAARIGILLANHAFRSSSRVRRVWVAAIQQSPSARECLYSVCMERRAFSHIRMGAVGDPVATLQSLGATMRLEGGALVPSDPLFYLEDERFCPPRRHDLWSLSERRLSTQASQSLGASRVSGLVIHEELPLAIAADEMLRGLVAPQLPGATETSVRAILEVAHGMSDISVWSAADRVVSKLVDGRLDTNDPEAVREEIVGGDALSRAMERAQGHMLAQEPHEALRTLRSVLDPLERSGTYDDTPAVAYRNFDSFSDRVLYNRLNAQDHRSIVLVPDAYLVAELLCSALLGSLPSEMGGDKQLALDHAMRAAQVAPHSTPATMTLAACLEANEDLEGAADALARYLESAHTPQGMGLAYFRLGSIEAQRGLMRVCQACFQRAVQLMPPLLPYVFAHLQELASNAEGADKPLSVELMGDEELGRVLGEQDIPLAPTQRTAFILYDGATASVDAEVFPVAQDLLRSLEVLTGDDVLRGIRTSLESEPDE